MYQAFAHFTGIAGLALVLASFVPEALSTPLAAFLIQDAPTIQDGPAVEGFGTANRTAKADRLKSSRPTRSPTVVSSVEVVGADEATIVLRDRFGVVLYHSDPLTSTTIVARDADIPSVTAHDAAQGAIVTRQTPNPDQREGGDGKAKRAIPPGCEGIVSALVNHELRKVPSWCMARAEGGRSS